ncbi:hypothetical protein HUZ36_16790 [Pseudoalteromonas sp. McH1-7]|uniref:Uncharacterized protein n=1 Tax=Pseudoalteromonas peptidolytica F12-50-A1 TaxID=1315280 RepID=A0A8I0T4J9_9GAMM|nr:MULTISPECIES: hypothetical protein [Pseudoalteromonas]MBE0347506.1 hypothetical protein [Pseudoalteromonas peptidolytica F12-50-A1]NLR13262.1 hypothetical protein [Pseudoalteromonas peptidolytica]NUZ12443.1 hypothetical protein [Pseudoalteromonas sp. McH1-7]RXF00633.1 hypothetical protein D9603_14810 [Pseudoalteromonas sp. PS5]GEK07874.1 hypothetical protein PPE03_01230 [Pseudoalteromonas peptidolytica]
MITRISLALILLLSISLPVVGYLQASADKALRSERLVLSELINQQQQQKRYLAKLEQRKNFDAAVTKLTEKASSLGLGESSLQAYKVNFRQMIPIAEIDAYMSQTHSQPGRFYVPQNFQLSREGMSLSGSITDRVKMLEHSQNEVQNFLLSYKGTALVVQK